MKNILRAIALTGSVLLLTASAFAQTDRSTVVNIPFNFSVADKALPAGKYVIRRNSKDSDTVWVLQNKQSGETAMLVTRSVHTNHTQEVAKFVFRQYDDLYILSSFWAAGTNTGRELQITSRERELEKSLAVKRTVHVLIDRAGQ